MEKTLINGKYFRVSTISKFISIKQDKSLVYENQEIKYGLAIEKLQEDGSYYVVAFVKPAIAAYMKPSSENLVLEDVNFRTVDMLESNLSIEDFWEMMQEYRNCVEFARNTLIDLQECE